MDSLTRASFQGRIELRILIFLIVKRKRNARSREGNASLSIRLIKRQGYIRGTIVSNNNNKKKILFIQFLRTIFPSKRIPGDFLKKSRIDYRSIEFLFSTGTRSRSRPGICSIMIMAGSLDIYTIKRSTARQNRGGFRRGRKYRGEVYYDST